MADSQGLFDMLSGAAGHPVDRPGLNAYVANSQALNGLRSAQTEDAMVKAQQAREEMDASSQLESAYASMTGPDGRPIMQPSAAHAAALISKAHFGNAKDAFEALGQAQKNGFAGILGDPNQIGSPAQTGAQQGIQGKVAEPVTLPNNYTTLAGTPPVVPQQSPQGAAQTAQTNAMTGLDVARAEDEHAKAKNAANPASSLDPQTLQDAALVVMADPTKMNQYAGFGQSGQNNKNGINNAIAKKLNDAGMNAGDMIRQRALAHASLGAAGSAAKQAQILDAYTPLVRSNGQRILQLLGQVGDDGGDMPLIAGLERAAGRQLGSDDLAELHSVFGTYQQEVSRLIASSPTMTGVISDKARSDVQSMAPESMTTNQAKRVVNRIDTEIGIRRQGVQGSLDAAIGTQLPVTSSTGKGEDGAPSQTPVAPSGGAASPPAGGAGGGATLPPAAIAHLSEGDETTFANGQVWTLRGGKPVQVR